MAAGGDVATGSGNSGIADESAVSETEIGALKDFAHRYRLSAPDNLGAGVVTLAMIAGYLNRKNNPTPGCKKIWEGYIKLVAMSQIYDLVLHMLTQKEG